MLTAEGSRIRLLKRRLLGRCFEDRAQRLGGAARPIEQVEPMESCAQKLGSGLNERSVFVQASRAQAADNRPERVDVALSSVDCIATGGVHGAATTPPARRRNADSVKSVLSESVWDVGSPYKKGRTAWVFVGVSDRLLTAAEVGELLDLSSSTILDRFEAGDLPGIRLFARTDSLGRPSGAVRFRLSEIEAALDGWRVGPDRVSA